MFSQSKLRSAWNWISTPRRPRRLNSFKKGVSRLTRRRTRTSTVSTYFTANDNNAEWSNRESTANPSNHPSTFLEPFRPWKIDLLKDLESVSHSVKEAHAFNPEDCSPHVYLIEDDCLTMHRLPIAQSTDAIRGKIGHETGMHMWKIHWPTSQRGTHAVIGVGTKTHALRSNGYKSLVGSEESGYGWDISTRFCYHNGKEKDPWVYPDPTRFPNFTIPDDIYCILDMDEGYLAYATDDQFLGVAFRDVKGRKLYPMISAVWGHCEITMEYMGAVRQVTPLGELCRRRIRDIFSREEECFIDDLPLPIKLKSFVDFESTTSF